MNRLRIALQGRDTCNGSCETHGGCDCLKPQVAASDDTDIVALRAVTEAAHAEIERDAYCAGWRWGLVNGLFAGGIFVATALFAGIHWFKG